MKFAPEAFVHAVNKKIGAEERNSRHKENFDAFFEARFFFCGASYCDVSNKAHCFCLCFGEYVIESYRAHKYGVLVSEQTIQVVLARV